MAYATEEQRLAARKESQRRSYLKRRDNLVDNFSKEYRLFYNARARAKAAGIPFELAISDIIIPEICPVLGIPISLTNKKNQPDSPSVDRVDNSQGYTARNICVISWRANRLKWNGSLEEFENIVRYMKEKA